MKVFITTDFAPTTTQYKLMIFHEYSHLILHSITRQAGSMEGLITLNPDLLNKINTSDNNLSTAHHKYFASNIAEFEGLLRSAFSGESEEFYKYGVWGGGATDSPEFDNLPTSERVAIRAWLLDNNL